MFIKNVSYNRKLKILGYYTTIYSGDYILMKLVNNKKKYIGKYLIYKTANATKID